MESKLRLTLNGYKREESLALRHLGPECTQESHAAWVFKRLQNAFKGQIKEHIRASKSLKCVLKCLVLGSVGQVVDYMPLTPATCLPEGRDMLGRGGREGREGLLWKRTSIELASSEAFLASFHHFYITFTNIFRYFPHFSSPLSLLKASFEASSSSSLPSRRSKWPGMSRGHPCPERLKKEHESRSISQDSFQDLRLQMAIDICERYAKIA